MKFQYVESQNELKLCGYFAIITSEEMNAKQAINLYKSRDSLEKLFRTALKDKGCAGSWIMCTEWFMP
ncbi:hypothetical protein HW273_09760 [Oribacterium sp. oral taxon 102]|uniref:hypothetical protein n=1 Tax=Oribacterium sp. oral taxon 102 TaxID=671214 RepID=UPI0015BA88FB|nr:hypothetical protein [Oribacterium sp. oral taxon 102]